VGAPSIEFYFLKDRLSLPDQRNHQIRSRVLSGSTRPPDVVIMELNEPLAVARLDLFIG
jgi:hypothetical protein